MQEMSMDDQVAATLRMIQPGESGIPLYLVHEVFGSTDCYTALGNALGPEQPVYAFEQPQVGYDIGIKELAARYVHDLKQFDPHGPYILGGYSFGGIVAFEMAQLLSDQGARDRVAFVVILDAWVPSADLELSSQEKWEILRQNLKTLGVPYLLLKIKHKVSFWMRMTSNRFWNATGAACERIKCSVPKRVRRAQIEKANIAALFSYKPSRYDGRVVLMASACRQTAASRRGDPCYGWGEAVGDRLEICRIAADHTSFLSVPLVGEVARQLQTSMSSYVAPVSSLSSNQSTAY
jgi:thioesterase domain-containing protein